MVNEFDSNKLIDTISFMCSKKNISANKMLLECNLNKSVLDNLKKGSIPSVDKVMKIADYFKISVDYLLGRTNEPNITYKNIHSSNIVNGNNGDNSPLTVTETEQQDEMTQELVKAFHSMSFTDKMEIMNAVLEKTKK